MTGILLGPSFLRVMCGSFVFLYWLRLFFILFSCSSVNNLPMVYNIPQQPPFPSTGPPQLGSVGSVPSCHLANGIPTSGNFHPMQINAGKEWVHLHFFPSPLYLILFALSGLVLCLNLEAFPENCFGGSF